ncbi:hypothetical protein FACS1894110_15880 [Spirochaetia bacterium]|nr:hypothetical protein FACS1894110_15880 [Spirochaetia bacterium]
MDREKLLNTRPGEPESVRPVVCASLLAKLQAMSIEEKLALLADTDKAYLRGYLDRAAFTRFADLPKAAPQDNLNEGRPNP